VFELAPPEPPSFSNFVEGRNGEAVARLAAVSRGGAPEASIVPWGGPGGGPSHLLRAAVSASARPGVYVATPAGLPEEVVDGPALMAVDDVDMADANAQGRLFTQFNPLAE